MTILVTIMSYIGQDVFLTVFQPSSFASFKSYENSQKVCVRYTFKHFVHMIIFVLQHPKSYKRTVLIPRMSETSIQTMEPIIVANGLYVEGT